jgi:hypothetical protein
MPTYTLRLAGPGARGARVSGRLLREVLNVLADGAQRALRLRLEGRSTAPGAVPARLARAADFDVVALREGSTVIELDAPALGEAASELFAQREFFETLSPDQSSIGLLGESLRDALDGKADSDLYDDGVLATIEELEAVFGHSIDRIEMTNGSLSPRGAITVDRERLGTVRSLRQSTPPNQRVRVAGWLDAIRHSDRMFTLKMEAGTTLRGVAQDVAPEQLARLFGRRAIVSGAAVFRPSGKVLRLEADAIEPAGENAELWAAEPVPLREAIDVRRLHQPQGPRSGIAAIIGQWPGDESDEDVAEGLRRLS